MRVPLNCSLSPEAALLALRGEAWPFALAGRWAGGGAIVGCNPTRLLAPGEDPFERLEDLPAPTGEATVGGGWFGWLGYGLGERVERLPPRPPRPVPLPDAHLAFYDHVLHLDADGQWWFETLTGDLAPLDRLQTLLAAAAEPPAAAAAAPGASADAADTPPAFTLRGGAGHVAAVADCVERIAAGEIFQANLCLRLEAAWDGDVAELFARARTRLQPAYSACFITPWGGIASLSPELFLRREGRDVTTGPIKGTAPHPEALQHSEKDRAEHVMIVDLMRNDLGRVAAFGSVHAPVEPQLQPHSGVWHLVSDVHATLAPSRGDADLLRATFPPGSVTGAPKVQALHVISQLESTGREVYTGAIGYVSPHAGLELNVAIRTFEHRAGRLWLGAGGGIVADSDPHAELEECMVKARPLVSAIGGTIAEHKVHGTLGFPAPLVHGRPDPALGVFETLHGRRNLEAHLARLRASVWELYGEELPEIDVPDVDAAVRIDYRPGGEVTVSTRPIVARPLPIVLTPYTLPGGLGAHKWRDRTLLDALDPCALLLDGDGTILEVAWASVIVERDGVRYTPREDGRILPSTSRPDAVQRDLTLQPGDELLVSSSLAGLLPAVLAGTSPAPPAGTPRTPRRTAAPASAPRTAARS
ncbi:para-aminobenzoate synthetase/4-amino-4-deoxychorismate lyase [Solirubrobacter pauli]|uniref:Para-aminobenzoate synthetase/4-amino-4-deoxychorismate lyase n=1 Tax=Solirubrobacter pauli TaxID=166793 RepID=A0A660LAS7_9ACTN|nr:para-aminobenzoate synthetase/4-amino-4-deoxychorismate lyase [Solirubrobacter pauli]